MFIDMKFSRRAYGQTAANPGQQVSKVVSIFVFFHLISLLVFGVAATTRRTVFLLLIILYRLWKGRGRVEKTVRKHMRRRRQIVL